MSGSSGACAKHTMRHGPFQGAGSSGSCSRMNRPVPYAESAPSASGRTSPARAIASGASPVGAGISRTEQVLAEAGGPHVGGGLREGRRRRRGTMLSHADRLE